LRVRPHRASADLECGPGLSSERIGTLLPLLIALISETVPGLSPHGLGLASEQRSACGHTAARPLATGRFRRRPWPRSWVLSAA